MYPLKPLFGKHLLALYLAKLIAQILQMLVFIQTNFNEVVRMSNKSSTFGFL